MAFRFSLETVLRLRQIVEEREERAMEEILRAMAQQRQELISLEKARERVFQQCDTLLKSKTFAAELRLLQEQIGALKDRELTGKERLARLEEQRQTQIKIYETACINRQLLSRIREQQVDQFRRVQARKEQMQMDDHFSCRRKLV